MGVNDTRILGLQGKTVNGSAEPGRGRAIVWGPRQRAVALESPWVTCGAGLLGF